MDYLHDMWASIGYLDGSAKGKTGVRYNSGVSRCIIVYGCYRSSFHSLISWRVYGVSPRFAGAGGIMMRTGSHGRALGFLFDLGHFLGKYYLIPLYFLYVFNINIIYLI
jgi:hypothetical protein